MMGGRSLSYNDATVVLETDALLFGRPPRSAAAVASTIHPSEWSRPYPPRPRCSTTASQVRSSTHPQASTTSMPVCAA